MLVSVYIPCIHVVSNGGGYERDVDVLQYPEVVRQHEPLTKVFTFGIFVHA